MKRTTILLCLIAMTLLLYKPLLAADVYVLAGSKGGDGSKIKPRATLWKAVEKAKRGDVIHVAAGAYEGKGGCGGFTIKVPNLTIVGGYTADFSKRDPFKNLTILQRAKDYKGDWTGLPDGIIQGDERSDHGGLVLDGLALDGRSRNAYDATGKILPKKSYNGCLLKVFSKDIKVRNCILLNPYGEGIYGRWKGQENEITNCFVLNTFREGISTRAAQPNSKVTIANCTISFCWFQPGKGGGIGVFVGKQGSTVLANNVLAFIQTEGGEAGHAVTNTFANEDTVMKGNVFFQCQGGYYKYMDEDNKNLLVWKAEDLSDLNEDAESYMLLEAAGNEEKDPHLKPDKEYFGKFASSVASEPGKLNMDTMNQLRQMLGLSLQAEPGTARQNWGMAYPLKAVAPNLISDVKGKGVQVAGPFTSYASKAAAEKPKDYQQIEFDSMAKGAEGVKALAGKPVTFKAKIGDAKTTFLLENAPRSDYDCYQLVKPTESLPSRKYAFGYFLKGSEAHVKWQKYLKKKDRYNAKGGVRIKGRAYYTGKETYAYPVGAIVDEVSRK